MSGMDSKIQKTLGHELNTQGLELVDFVPVPKHNDRMVRFRTVQEVLDDFDSLSDDESNQTYLVHVRKRPVTSLTEKENAVRTDRPATSGDGIYLTSGKLNSAYLLDNAKLLFSAGEYSSARQIYQTLKTSGELTAAALLGTARCFEAEGNTNEAIKNYDESILYSPSLESYQRFAALLIRNKKNQQAAEVLERALHLKSISDQTRFSLQKAAGNCFLQSGLMMKAEKHLRAAFETKPDSDQVAAHLGLLYLQQGKIIQAEVAFTQACQINPKNDQAMTGLASLHLSQGDMEKAHDAFAQTLRVNLNNPKAIFHLVKCAYRTGKFTTACELLSEYVQIAPFNANLLYSLAGLQYHLNLRYEAKRTIEQIISIQPQHAEANNLKKLIEQSQ